MLALVLYGAPVPRLSEELYLPLARHVGDPAYLAGDWTMRGTFGEHWLFDHVMGPVAAAVPLVWLGWIGRIATAIVLAGLLVASGRRIGLTPVAAGAGIALWLVANQSLVGVDWMFGTFEAKTVAYCVVAGALLATLAGRAPVAVVLLGAAIAVHPAAGAWAALPIAVALLVDGRTRGGALRWAPAGVALALVGIVPALGSITPPTATLQRFLVLQVVPYHADPFFGGRSLPGLQAALRAGTVALMLAANVAWWRRSAREPAATRLVVVQLAAIATVVVAFVARALELWPVLLLQPMRFGPMIVPLCFFWNVARVALDPGAHRRTRLLVGVGGSLVALCITSPFLAAPRMIARSAQAWSLDDEARAFGWLRDHTEPTTRCIVPIDRQDAFMRAERPIVANWQAVRFDDVAEWSRRVHRLTGGPAVFANRPVDLAELRAAYDDLTVDEVRAIAARYDATCLVATTRYPLPVRHRVGTVRIYRIPGTDAP